MCLVLMAFVPEWDLPWWYKTKQEFATQQQICSVKREQNGDFSFGPIESTYVSCHGKLTFKIPCRYGEFF